MEPELANMRQGGKVRRRALLCPHNLLRVCPSLSLLACRGAAAQRGFDKLHNITCRAGVKSMEGAARTAETDRQRESHKVSAEARSFFFPAADSPGVFEKKPLVQCIRKSKGVKGFTAADKRSSFLTQPDKLQNVSVLRFK